MDSTEDFPKRGTFYIGMDRFSYTGKTADAFTGVVRRTQNKLVLPEGAPVSLFRLRATRAPRAQGSSFRISAYGRCPFTCLPWTRWTRTSIPRPSTSRGPGRGRFAGQEVECPIESYQGSVLFPMYAGKTIGDASSFSSMKVEYEDSGRESRTVECEAAFVSSDVIAQVGVPLVEVSGDGAFTLNVFDTMAFPAAHTAETGALISGGVHDEVCGEAHAALGGSVGPAPTRLYRPRARPAKSPLREGSSRRVCMGERRGLRPRI